MRARRPFLLVAAVLVIVAPVSRADEAEANRLFVEAVKLWGQAQRLPVADRWDLYRQIRENLEAIVGQHPDSSLAVRLVIGEIPGPIDWEYLEHVLREYAPERRAEAVTIEAVVREAFRDRSRKMPFWCREDEALPRSSYTFSGRIMPPDDRFEGSYGDTFLSGRYLPPRTLLMDNPRMTLVFDDTGRARGSSGMMDCVLDLTGLWLRLRLQVGCAPADRLCRIRTLLDWALATARTIEDAALRNWRLQEIAAAQAKAGDVEGARRTLEEAFAAARTIEDAVWRSLALAKIAAARAEAGDVAGALETARTIEDAVGRSQALSGIAVARAKAGDVAGALETARTIEDKRDRSNALRDIAVAQAEAGDLEGALRTADSIPEKESRARAWVDVALAAARAELR